MKFLIVFALLAVTCVIALPTSPANNIIAAHESSREQQPTETIKPPFTPQGHTSQGVAHRPIPHRNAFIAAAGAFITKLVRNLPKAISGDIPKEN